MEVRNGEHWHPVVNAPFDGPVTKFVMIHPESIDHHGGIHAGIGVESHQATGSPASQAQEMQSSAIDCPVWSGICGNVMVYLRL